MGLLKNKILANGIPTNYHKIDSVLVNTEIRKIIVDVNSYVNESVRIIEKENQEKKLLCKELNDFIDANIGTEDEEITEQIKQKTNQYNEIIDTIIDTSSYVVDKNTYELDYDTNISFEAIYTQLKQLDDFQGAEDVI